MIHPITTLGKPCFPPSLRKNEALKGEGKLELEPGKSEWVVLWLFIAILVTLTAVAGYLFWKKLSSTL